MATTANDGAVLIIVLLVSVLLGLALHQFGVPPALAIALGCVPIGWLAVLARLSVGIRF